MGGRIAAIFALIVVAGIALYIYNSGALQSGYQGFQSLIPHPTTSTTQVPPATGTNGGSQTYSGGGSAGGSTGGDGTGEVIGPAPAPTPTSTISPYDIPPGFTMSQISPYFHQIRFGGVAPSYGFGTYGTISIFTNFQNPSSSLDVTGWQIKTAKGQEFIPQAINLYDPSGLTQASDIHMSQGDYVNIYSSSAPFNLRLNKCIGYIAVENNQFNPPLPQTCPYLDQSQIYYFSGACQNFLLSVGNCAEPDLNSPYYPHNDPQCDQYVQSHFNYLSCFNDHLGDSDFSSHEIDVWTGYDPLDQYHDRVQLLDAKGLLVDYYNY